MAKVFGRKLKGFTLIEVMVALAIFALTGVAILKVTQEHLRSLSTIQDISFATWVANNQMTEATLKAKIEWPLKNNAKGEVEMAGQKWFWQQTVKKTPEDSLFEVSIAVAKDQEMRNTITTVSTFIASTET